MTRTLRIPLLAALLSAPSTAAAESCHDLLATTPAAQLVARAAGASSDAAALLDLSPSELRRALAQDDPRIVTVLCVPAALGQLDPADSTAWLTSGQIATPMNAEVQAFDTIVHVLAVDPGDDRARAAGEALVARMDTLRGLPAREYDWALDLEQDATLPFRDPGDGRYPFARHAARLAYDELVAGVRLGEQAQLGVASRAFSWAEEALRAAQTRGERQEALELELAVTLRVGRLRAHDLTVPPYRQGNRDALARAAATSEDWNRAGDQAAAKLMRTLPRDASGADEREAVTMLGEWARFRVWSRNDRWEDHTFAMREGTAPDGTPLDYDPPAGDQQVHRLAHRVQERLRHTQNAGEAADDRLQSIHAELLALATRMAAQQNAGPRTALSFVTPHRAVKPTLKDMTAVHIWGTPAEKPSRRHTVPAPAATPGPLLVASVCAHLFASPVVVEEFGMLTPTTTSDPFGSLRTATSCR